MLDFVYVSGRTRPSLSLGGVENVTPFQKADIREVSGRNGTLRFWSSGTTPLSRDLNYCKSISGWDDLYLYFGYSFDANGNVIDSAERFIEERADVSGNYFWLRWRDGEIELERSDISSYPIYYLEHKDLIVVSSSILTCVEVLRRNFGDEGFELNPDNLRWVFSYSFPANSSTFDKRVHRLEPGATLAVRRRELSVRKGSGTLASIMDFGLREKYRADRVSFWDECFDSLRNNMRLVELTNQQIEFPLSGGKDSRLVLALLLAAGQRDRIRSIYTNGPEISPEVRSARAVCMEC